MNPFDFVKDISFDKKNLIEGNEKEYNPWLTNKAFSYHSDSIFVANEVNKYNGFGIESNLQHDFLFHMLDKKRRFSRWSKTSINEDIELISKYYKVSISKAKDYYDILLPEQIEHIKLSQNHGGMQ